jgi:hypothetical protein
MQARKYQKNCSNITSKITPYNSTKNTPRDTRDPPKLHFYYPQNVAANTCTKITKKKMGENERERGRDFGIIELL